MKIPQNVFLILLIFTSLTLAEDNIQSSFVELDQSVNNDNQVSGKMTINGITYNAICDCNPVTPEQPQTVKTGPKCDPSKLRIHGEKNGIGATYDDIRNLVGNIEELTYVVVPETSFKCLDGRNTKGVIATPGGDAGEFILALSVYEDLLGGRRLLSQENVDNFLTQYLKIMKPKKFYMCTDDKAIAHLEKELSVIVY
jgi:hypothetical protein